MLVLLVALSLVVSVVGTHKRIYVMGPESSGTRYLASGVSLLFDKESEWSGYIPGCHYISREISIQHVSLPSNGRCTGEAPLILPHVDKCEKIPQEYRWFANITNILQNDPLSIAIFISRDEFFTTRSIEKNHCSMGGAITKQEFDTGKWWVVVVTTCGNHANIEKNKSQ